MNNRRGRPIGASTARDRILVAARTRFVELGYRATTTRAIAADADIDASLIAYHFGSKRGLFVQSVAMSFSPADVFTVAAEGHESDLAGRILSAVMNIWEDPELGPAMRTFVIEALQHPDVLEAFREYMEIEVLARAKEMISGPRASQRVAAAFPIFMGLIFSRYLFSIPTMTHPSPHDMHKILLPTLQRALRR